MADYTLENPTVIAVLKSLGKHDNWIATDPDLIELELDIPRADIEEEEDGFFLMRTDRVLDVVDAMNYLIELKFVEGDIRANKDRFICEGIKLTTVGRDHIQSD